MLGFGPLAGAPLAGSYGPAVPSGVYTLNITAGSFTLTGLPSTGHPVKTISLDAGAFALTGVANAMNSGYFLAAAPFVYAVSVSSTSQATRKLPLGSGQFNLTFPDRTSAPLYQLNAVPGSFSLGGRPNSFVRNRGFIPTTGVFALASPTSKITLTRRLSTSPGAYQGIYYDAVMRYGFTFNVPTGVYALHGRVALLKDYRILLEGGSSFGLTGFPVSFNATHVFSNTRPGTFNMSGTAMVRYGRQLIPASYSRLFSISLAFGNAAALYGKVYRQIAVAPAPFAFSGQAAALLRTRQLAAGSRAFALTGLPVTLSPGKSTPFQPGVFAYQGGDIAAKRNFHLTLAKGTFVLLARDVSASYSGDIEGRNNTPRWSMREWIEIANPSYSEWSVETDLPASNGMALTPGIFSVAAYSAGLGRKLVAPVGTYTLIGEPGNFG